MIDGPACGTNLDILPSVGPAQLLADPAQNFIFSAHAYCYSYAANNFL